MAHEPGNFALLPVPRIREDGGAEGIRTPDPHNAIVVLYQLSYDPNRLQKKGAWIGGRSGGVKEEFSFVGERCDLGSGSAGRLFWPGDEFPVTIRPELLPLAAGWRRNCRRNTIEKLMKSVRLPAALEASVSAARRAGELMRRNLRRTKKINEATAHDIKLELDVRCQRVITQALLAEYPDIPVLGEEGYDDAVVQAAEWRWVVDPIDGTVNYAHGIPHACVCIALQSRRGNPPGAFETVTGVVLDPFQDELWTAIQSKPARLNGRVIRVSRRRKLAEAVVSLGFAKSQRTLDQMLPVFQDLMPRVRKIRLMGSAGLALTYVADGRFDAYLEAGVRLWDIAAGGLIVECAGGEFGREPIETDHRYAVNVNNGLIDAELKRILRAHE